MQAPIAIGTLLSLLIGLSLGLLGGGGSILTVPVLVYVLALPPKSAIALSLLVVGVASGVATIIHARGGRVSFRTGLLFGPATMAGAFAGGRVARFIPEAVLLLAFGIMMLAAAGAMMRKREEAPEAEAGRPAPKLGAIVAIGAALGFVTGLIGAGGGFVIVPALVLLARLRLRVAIGTSLLVIMMSSFAAFAGYLGHVDIDWHLAAMVTGMAAAGSLLGGRLSAQVPQETLRRAFAWFVVVMGVFMLSQQIPEVAASAGLGRIPWYAAVCALAAIALIGALAAAGRRTIHRLLSHKIPSERGETP